MDYCLNSCINRQETSPETGNQCTDTVVLYSEHVNYFTHLAAHQWVLHSLYNMTLYDSKYTEMLLRHLTFCVYTCGLALWCNMATLWVTS